MRAVPFRQGFGDDAANMANPLYVALNNAYVRVRQLNEQTPGLIGYVGAAYDAYINGGNLLDGLVSGAYQISDPSVQTYASNLIAALNSIQAPGPAAPAIIPETVVQTTSGPVVGTPDPLGGLTAAITPSGLVVGSGNVNTATGQITTAGVTPATTHPAASTAAPGFLTSIEDTLSDSLQGVATQFGLSVQTVEIAAVILVLGGLWMLSGKKRR